MNINDHAVIVTGGASGLGAATARGLAAAGARVTIFDLNPEQGQTIAREIGGLYVQVDVATEMNVVDGIKKAEQANGDTRILVNCAGINLPARTVSKGEPHPLDRFSRVIEVNLTGTFNCIRLVAKNMCELEPLADGERGVVINTASVAAYEGQVGQASYSASKSAIAGMTLPIARDLANSGIRVCSIAPGMFMTPLLETVPEEMRQSLAASVPFPKRLGNPLEFAGLVQHICENVMLNGEVIRLDGAIRMAPK